jgi:hypothetical protein
MPSDEPLPFELDGQIIRDEAALDIIAELLVNLYEAQQEDADQAA